MRTEPQDELAAAIEENLKISKKILELAEKTRRYNRWQAVSSWIHTILVLIPLVAAAIFLPPLISKLMELYSSVSDAGSGLKFDFEQLQQFNEEAGKYIKQ